MKRHLNASNQNHHTVRLSFLQRMNSGWKWFCTQNWLHAVCLCMINVFRQYFFSTWNNCYWTGIFAIIGTLRWSPFISNAPNQIKSNRRARRLLKRYTHKRWIIMMHFWRILFSLLKKKKLKCSHNYEFFDKINKYWWKNSISVQCKLP